MWRFIVGLLATVGTLTLIAIGGTAAFVASGPFASKPLAQPIVLSIDLRTVPSESKSSGLLHGGLFGGSRDIIDTVQLLWQAADDPRVGMAYNLTPRTVVRSGFGVYYDNLNLNELQFTRLIPPCVRCRKAPPGSGCPIGDPAPDGARRRPEPMRCR